MLESGTSEIGILGALSRNIKDLSKAASWTSFLSGILIVFISTTGPIAILYQAAAAGKLSSELTNSWLFSVFLGSGLFGLFMTLRFRMPIIGSWAATTTALLITGLADHKFSDVIGAYFGASLLLLIVGYAGAFNKLMKIIPNSIIMAMLAGVLLSFGTRIFTATKLNPLLGFVMILIFYFGKFRKLRAPLLFAFFVGITTVIMQGKLHMPVLDVNPVTPIFIAPTFSIGAFFTLAIPIFLMVMTTQNAPGIAMLKAANYQPPVDAVVKYGGILSMLGAGFGGAGVNISSMTAAIALSPECDPNPKTRYFSGVSAGLTYSLAAIFAGIFSSLYSTFPTELTMILAGLALLPVILNSLVIAIEEKNYRESAVITFLVTISGVSGGGVGAPFWGLLAGLLVHRIIERR